MTEMMEDMDKVLELVDEEGVDHDFEILDMIEMDGKKYFILLPLDDEEDEEEDAAIVMRVDVDENGEDLLCEIEDDEEWKRVTEAYDALYD